MTQLQSEPFSLHIYKQTLRMWRQQGRQNTEETS